MILDSTVRSIAFALGEAKTTNDCDITASYVDVTTTAYTPGTNTLTSNGVTKVAPVAAPAASTQRQVKEIRINNNDTVTHTFILYYDDNGTYRVMDRQLIPANQTYVYTPTTQFAAVPLVPLPGFLGGLGLSNDATTPNTVFDIAAGTCCSDDNSTMMTLASAFTKTTGSWAAGTGSGALDTGSAANAWYHVYVIFNPATGVTDILISLSISAPTMPSGYTKKRRIGSVLLDGSVHLTAFVQQGNLFELKVPVNVASALAVTQTASNVTVVAPPGLKGIALFNMVALNTGGAANFYAYDPDLTAVSGASPVSGAAVLSSPSANNVAAGMMQVQTNVSQQVAVVSATNANNAVYMASTGWIDRRGQG